MDIQDQTGLKGLFQSMIPDSVGVIKGQVTSDSPLEIRIINDEKLVLNKNLLCVPRHLTDYTTICDIDNTSGGHSHPLAGGGGEHGHTQVKIKMYNGLKKDDVVYLLSFNGGKKYYVLDREE